MSCDKGQAYKTVWGCKVAQKNCRVVLAGMQGIKLDAFCIHILPVQGDLGVNHLASCTLVSVQSEKLGLLGKMVGE